MRLKWTRAASQDLETVERYISRDNPEAAIDTVLEIIGRLEILAEHPGMGRPWPGRVEGSRELCRDLLRNLATRTKHFNLVNDGWRRKEPDGSTAVQNLRRAASKVNQHPTEHYE